jgi:prevent-host-death family protein
MKDRTVTVTEAARNFADIVNRARYRSESTLLVKNGVPVARIVPAAVPRTTREQLLAWWRSHPRLETRGAAGFEKAIARARKRIESPRNPWE